MVQPDYTDDHMIMLLLKEMEELADVRTIRIIQMRIENQSSSFLFSAQ